MQLYKYTWTSNLSLVRSLCDYKVCSWAHWWNVKNALSLAHHKEKHKTVAPLLSSPDAIFWYLQVYPWEIQRSYPHCTAEFCWSWAHGWTDGRKRPWDHHVYLTTTPCIHFDLCSPSVQCLAHLVPQTAFHMSDVALFPAVSNLKQKGGSGKGIVTILC